MMFINIILSHMCFGCHLDQDKMFVIFLPEQVLLAFVLPALLSTNGLMAWSTTDSLAWLKWVYSV